MTIIKPMKWYIAKDRFRKDLRELSDKHLKSIRNLIDKNPNQIYSGFTKQEWNKVIDQEFIRRKEAYKTAERIINYFSIKTGESGNLKKVIKKYLTNNQVAVSS